ncbi:MAG: hypothetical protein RBU21_19530, partial [FCB group bacterium]|nr:hypothetical protein [FCB group bacterium]
MKLIMAMLAGCVSVVYVVMPWRWRRPSAFWLRATLYWLESRFKFLVNTHKQIVTSQEQTFKSIITSQPNEGEEEIPEGDKVAVCYSGGCDSTLAALLLGKRFKQIHLVTFHNAFTYCEEEVLIRAKLLKDKLGEDRIV